MDSKSEDNQTIEEDSKERMMDNNNEKKAAEVLLDELTGGDNLPLNETFAELAGIWFKKNPKATSRDLADHLGIKPQSCSQWKTGSDGRRPTWKALLTLASELNKEIVVTPKRVYLKRHRRRTDESREQG